MAWTLEKAKQILGVSDQDAQIQAVMDTTLASIETMLQRGLLEQQDSQLFQDLFTHKIRLRRFPVKEIITVDDDPMPDTWVLNPERGWILLPAPAIFKNMTIVYTGGYETLPLDLEWCMWEAFKYLWDETNGVPSDGLNADPSKSGDISRVTVQDFGSVTFDAGGNLSGEASAKVTQRVLDWGWLAPWASTLQNYRSEYGTGLGMA